MNRRTALRSLLVVPGAAALPAVLDAQEPVVLPTAPRTAPNETPRTPTVNADSFADGVLQTFTAGQFAALHKLGSLIVPSSPETPGADEANAAAFLDFLIGQSSQARLELYRNGLNAIDTQSHHLYKKSFAGLTGAEAAPILSPLRQPWTYREPTELLPRFLLAAKEDLIRATTTSREYIAVVSKRRRNAGGSGQYWLPIE